jgi:rhodanese-related sulfurtransferase
MSTSSWFLILAALVTLVVACRPKDGTSAQVKQLVADGALLVDVRSDAEFAQGSLPGAIHVPHDQAETRLEDFGGKDAPVVVFCRSGRRSGLVKRMLESKGWTQVHNGGGISSLR